MVAYMLSNATLLRVAKCSCDTTKYLHDDQFLHIYMVLSWF